LSKKLFFKSKFLAGNRRSTFSPVVWKNIRRLVFFCAFRVNLLSVPPTTTLFSCWWNQGTLVNWGWLISLLTPVLQTSFAEQDTAPNRDIQESGSSIQCVCYSRKIPYLADERPIFLTAWSVSRGSETKKKEKHGRDENKRICSPMRLGIPPLKRRPFSCSNS
jgi:hypothetical protein